MLSSGMKREPIVEAVHAALAAVDAVEGAWIGGSDAFGRADDLSDIDVAVVVPEESVAHTFDAVEAALERLGGIAAVWRVPLEGGFEIAQRFYRLHGAPEWLMIDVALVRPDQVDRWLDPVRHGVPRVLFDRTGRIRPVDDASLAARFAESLVNLKARTALLGHLPAKELARGKVVEAHYFWQKFLIGTLVEVLRARYAPRRQDFGLRYLDLDLPSDVYARLEKLMLVGDAAGLGRAIDATRTWLDEELAALPT